MFDTFTVRAIALCREGRIFNLGLIAIPAAPESPGLGAPSTVGRGEVHQQHSHSLALLYVGFTEPIAPQPHSRVVPLYDLL